MQLLIAAAAGEYDSDERQQNFIASVQSVSVTEHRRRRRRRHCCMHC